MLDASLIDIWVRTEGFLVESFRVYLMVSEINGISRLVESDLVDCSFEIMGACERHTLSHRSVRMSLGLDQEHQMQRTPDRIAVYGTLKQNQSNHGFLAGQRYLGQEELNSITLFDLGPYPAAKLRESQGVCVEVYEITDEALARLDELEGYHPSAPDRGLYNRVKLETPSSHAWVYIYNHDVTGCHEIRFGEWFPCRN